MASNKDARGTRKWGLKTPGGRVAGVRRCLGSRAGSGGRRRNGGLLRREGGRCARLRAPGRFSRSVCAEPSGRREGLWLAGYVRSAHPRAVPGTRVSVRACMGALCLAPRPQVSGCPCRWQGWGLLPWAAGEPAAAAGGGVTGVWFISPRTGARQEGLRLAAAALLWAMVGGGCLRCRETRLLAHEGKCTALSQVGRFLGIQQKKLLPSQRI